MLLLNELERRPLDLDDEGLRGEVSITARWVRPQVERVVESLSHLGLVVAGDGGLKVRALPVLGLLFTPDVAVYYYEQPLFALEVKLVREGSGQTALTRAIGQATIYREWGFPFAGVLVLNAGGLPSTMTTRLEMANLPLIIRPVPRSIPRVREESDD